jgi:hypothetical protein
MQREVENTRIDVTAQVSGRLTRTPAARGQEVAAGNARNGLGLSPVLEDGRFRLRPHGIRSLMLIAMLEVARVEPFEASLRAVHDRWQR